MTAKMVNGTEWKLPYRGRLGCAIKSTLGRIMLSDGIALYAAMDLHGAAKSYAGRYRNAFVRFADANPDKLIAGYVGPKGGWGYKFVGGSK